MKNTKNQTSKAATIATTFAIIAAASQTSHAAIAIDPTSWGLSVGDTFQLVMVTNGGTPATSTDITTYDAFVNTQGLSGITYNGSALNRQAIGLTPGSNPLTDTTRYSSLANGNSTYNLAGQQVSSTVAGTKFWRITGGNSHTAAIDRTIDLNGVMAQVGGSTWVWTGFDYNANPATERDYDNDGRQIGTVSSTLGTSASYTGITYVYDDEYNYSEIPNPGQTHYATFGRAGASANGWASLGSETPLSTSQRMYAISSPITVTAIPEPSSMTMIALAGTVLLRRRRQVC